ncbi:10677_t:CDS:2 [Paraglomus occultum]|uniref:adenine phosphoribosyltransferase n=1 Tax=Paraglomus occultum TaxID=144539 RepID=A0A9N9EY42_9GLOM|nr:10677_t:CDS:2 [Paraglomus occultum]
MKVSSNQQARIKSIILIFIIVVLTTAVAARPPSNPPPSHATVAYGGGCTGTFGDIQKSSSYTDRVEAYLTIVCDAATVVTVQQYYMVTVFYGYINTMTDVTVMSPSPLTFTVSPGTSATFIVAGEGCFAQVYYEAYVKTGWGHSVRQIDPPIIECLNYSHQFLQFLSLFRMAYGVLGIFNMYKFATSVCYILVHAYCQSSSGDRYCQSLANNVNLRHLASNSCNFFSPATSTFMADVEKIKSFVKAIPDFPKEGIIFRDIFPIFRDPSAVEALLTHIAHHVQSTTNEKIDVVLGLDARGFLFGPLLALRLHSSFAPIRKKGKLPGSTISASYTKEYGVDEFELQADAIQKGQNVIIVDDLIATGGSAYAAKELVEKAGGRVIEFVFVIELIDLKGRDKLGGNVYSVVQY